MFLKFLFLERPMTFEDLLEDDETIEQLSLDQREDFQYWHDFMCLSEPRKYKKEEPNMLSSVCEDPNLDKFSIKTYGLATFSALPLVIAAEEGGHALAALSVGGTVTGFGIKENGFNTYFYTLADIPNGALSQTICHLSPKLALSTIGMYMIRQGLKTKNPAYVGMGATFVSSLGETFLPYMQNDISMFIDHFLPEGSTLKVGLSLGLASLMLLTAYSGSGILLKVKEKASNFFGKFKNK